ncbi:hypothetical protein DYB32_010199 [Aphanomyces invadans]|uniref:PX domain-containing protein n=1 Tax=Aphanomyces invadans TaxID=157072 RepID=A0A418AG46_9STRA|nr:hypothetical protein DYB32_010199 [Aphanomyces invadans]
MGLSTNPHHLLASVTSCIGAAAPHREKYVVCVKVEHKLPATLWYTYKCHSDFVEMFQAVVDATAKMSCAQECSIRCAVASLSPLLDARNTDKLENLNKFLLKIVDMVHPTSDHADACLLRPRVDAVLKAFLEWRDDAAGRVGLKRQLSLPSLLLTHNQQQPDCLVVNGSKFGGSHSYPVKVTKLDTTNSSASVLPASSPPLAVLRKFCVLEASSTATPSISPSTSTTCSSQMFQQSNVFSGDAMPSTGRRRVFTEVNFDGM